MIAFYKILHLANLYLGLVQVRQLVHCLIESLLKPNIINICSILSDSVILCNGIRKVNILQEMALLYNRFIA